MGKYSILQMLSNASGYISGEEISKKLNISRAAVWKNIKALQSDGYYIDSATNRGYILKGGGNDFSGCEIARRLPNWYNADLLHFSDTVDSTNTRLKELDRTECQEFTAYVADRQTGGKGRMGRNFFSPSSAGVYVSMLYRPHIELSRLGTITAFSAVAICKAIEKITGLQPGIKWVNDIVIGGKKVCGILTEMSIEAESSAAQYVIVGCGINANPPEGGYPPEIEQVAGSLSQFTRSAIDRSNLAAEVIARLAKLLSDFSENYDMCVEEYKKRCITIGQDIRVNYGNSNFKAKALDIDNDCGLIIQLPDGSRKALTYGEVSVRGLYGYSE